MALKDNASLALIPAAYKTSKVYSALPTDGDGDFTFSRTGSATRVNKAGLIQTMASNEPRLDYPLIDGVVQDCPVLLLEPSRTNSLTYSTLAFNGGSIPTGWTVGFGTGTFSHTETTYKGQGAVKHTQITTGRSYLGQAINLSTSTTYTLRVEFDRDNSSGIDDNDTILSTVAIDSSFSKKWSDVDDNGVLEVQFTTGADASGELRIGFGAAGNEDGGKTIVFSMPQLEVGSYATSYIPTEGSPETRSADTCNGAGDSSTFNDSEGVLFAEIEALANDLTYRGISIGDGTVNNVVRIYYENVSNRFTANIKNAGVSQATMIYTFTDITVNSKIAVKYKQNDFALWVNGTEVATDLSGNAPTGLDVLQFDTGTGGDDFYGKVKDLRVYNTALTDEQLEKLTTI